MSLDPKNVLALIVGVEKYDGGDGWNLSGPTHDGSAFAKWLLVRGVTPKNIHCFFSSLNSTPPKLPGKIQEHNATEAELKNFLTIELPNKQPKFLLLFWGGHGMIKGNERHLFFADAREKNMRSLNLDMFLQFLGSEAMGEDPETVRTLVIVDACADYAELKGVAGAITPISFPDERPVPGRSQFVLFSTSKGQYAKELSARQTGMFSNRLLTRFEKDADLDCLHNIENVADELVDEFKGLVEKGEAAQAPSFFQVRSWQSNNDSSWGERPARPPATGPGAESRVSHQEVEELCRLTAGAIPPVPDSVTVAAFSAIVPGIILPPYEGMERFRACLHILASSFAQQIFQFLELCRPHLLGGELPVNIQEWEKTVASRLGQSLENCRAAAKKLKVEPLPSADLLQVIIDPVEGLTGGRDEYLMWMRVTKSGASQEPQVFVAGERAHDRAGLGMQFQDLFRKAFSGIGTINKFRIEAALPRELLYYGIEDWLVFNGSRCKRVGKLYSVALRSHERAYNSDFRDGLLLQKQKWGTLQAGLSPKHFVWLDNSPVIDPDEASPWKSPDNIALCALELRPPAQALIADVMEALIMSGIPLAVWLHGLDGTVSMTASLDALKKLFAQKAHENWIEEGRVFRQASPEQRQPRCQELVVLWDNPLQSLPSPFGRKEAPLQSPTHYE